MCYQNYYKSNFYNMAISQLQKIGVEKEGEGVEEVDAKLWPAG